MKTTVEAATAGPAATASAPAVMQVDDYTLPKFLLEARRFGSESFGYVVTPNVDHMIYYHDSSDFRAVYAGASYVLLDSRVAAFTLRLTHGLRIPVCTGSDLTAALLDEVIVPGDSIVLIGARAWQAELLRKRYSLEALHHYDPPMGFMENPEEVEKCLQFVEANSPFRFCLLALGTPRQELLALRLAQRGLARGLTFCVGASINFLTGAEQRAPAWMRAVGLEWLYRLLRNPRRLAWRYLVRGPRFFAYVGSSQILVRGSRPIA